MYTTLIYVLYRNFVAFKKMIKKLGEKLEIWQVWKKLALDGNKYFHVSQIKVRL